MSNQKTAKWEVVALGELQQPSGVGGTQQYNPVTDGPNPNGPNFGDNAGNSPEQEQATETWVNMAVDMLNRGEDPAAILAQLAHDGCPNPEEVYQRAATQPNQSPISDDGLQNPLEAPQPQDSPTGQMESVSQQPAVLGSVRIAGQSWPDYAVTYLKYAGETEPAVDPKGHPVSEVEKFIANMPKVEPTRPYIEARLQNVEKARRAIRGLVSKATYADQQKLAALDYDLGVEQQGLKDVYSSDDFLAGVFSYDRGSGLRDRSTEYRYDGLGLATVDAALVPAFAGNPREAGRIWAAESPYGPSADVEDFQTAAMHYAGSLNMRGEQFQEFLKAATETAGHRPVRTEEFTAEVENEGPAEALFI